MCDIDLDKVCLKEEYIDPYEGISIASPFQVGSEFDWIFQILDSI